MIKQIRKRDGRLQKFDPAKIAIAINKAFGGTRDLESFSYAHDIVKTLNERNVEVIDIEEVQDEVEKYLMGIEPETAKKYILYRRDRKELATPKKQSLIIKRLLKTI